MADIDTIQAHAPELDDGFVRAQLEGLEDAYFERFGAGEIAEHLRALSALGPDHPFTIRVEPLQGRRVRVSIFAFDYPFEFSLITGVLSGAGFRIAQGDIFTTHPVADERGRKAELIIDRFEGEVAGRESIEAWAGRVEARLGEVLELLAAGDEKSVERAKHLVNEMVTRRLKATRQSEWDVLYPVQLDIEPLGHLIRLRVVGQDTPAFLYSLSTALSLHGLAIERVRIGGEGEAVEDDIDVISEEGKRVDEPETIEAIRFSVLLTKQFTYFLDRAPDPYTALTRFAELVGKLRGVPGAEMLAKPRAMQELARLLGASDYLWEDFIRLQYEQLVPVFEPHLEGRQFTDPIESLPDRMDAALEGAVGLAEQRDRLNKFKDEEIFRIDLDHILTQGSDFTEMSERLTALAEHLVDRAAALVYEDLVRSFGHPLGEEGDPCPYAVFGLGKLGGVALGYASDIELLFVYGSNGQTTGGKRKVVDSRTFYEYLVRDVARFIKTKREAIFQVDLRLRPFGDAGPLAVSRGLFERYYAPGGKAHAFERLALVRLRWIAGDPSLGRQIESMRDAVIYESGVFDLEALWEIWEKQHAQKAISGELNAKYTPGALVDLETTVQLLQLRHGHEDPALRTPQIREALDALRRAGALKTDECDELIAAYRFLRRLINGLRMLRGSAEDLGLPDRDSDELLHLARRLGYEDREGMPSPGDRLLSDFADHTITVQRFVERHFERPCPGTGDPG